MSSFLRFVKYQVRTCWGPIHWACLAFVLLFPVVFTPPALPGSAPAGAPVGALVGTLAGAYVLETTQVFLPLLGIAAMAGLASAEYEAGTSETVLTSPFSRAGLLLTRCGLALLYVSVLFAVVLGAYYARGEVSVEEAQLGWVSTLIPAVYLGSLGLLVGLATRSTAPALLVPTGYWLMEVFTKGRYTGRLYLFSYGSSQVSYGGSQAGSILAKVPIVQATLAILGVAVALFEMKRD